MRPLLTSSSQLATFSMLLVDGGTRILPTALPHRYVHWHAVLIFITVSGLGLPMILTVHFCLLLLNLLCSSSGLLSTSSKRSYAVMSRPRLKTPSVRHVPSWPQC